MIKKNLDLSPNCSNKKRANKNIKFIVIHYTGMQSEIESIKRLKNPKHQVSCHYLITRKGKVIQMVRERNVAWHAGRSKWKNFHNLNSKSIGIELVNKGHRLGYQNYSNAQIKSLIKLFYRQYSLDLHLNENCFSKDVYYCHNILIKNYPQLSSYIEKVLDLFLNVDNYSHNDIRLILTELEYVINEIEYLSDNYNEVEFFV